MCGHKCNGFATLAEGEQLDRRIAAVHDKVTRAREIEHVEASEALPALMCGHRGHTRRVSTAEAARAGCCERLRERRVCLRRGLCRLKGARVREQSLRERVTLKRGRERAEEPNTVRVRRWPLEPRHKPAATTRKLVLRPRARVIRVELEQRKRVQLFRRNLRRTPHCTDWRCQEDRRARMRAPIVERRR